jgi:hypothetical protein
MDFKYYLLEQLKKHPVMQPQDVVKMCYQAAFGAEHLLADVSAAKRYFDAEFDAIEPREGELFESLSDAICRVDLGVWKAKGLSKELLFEAFCAAARVESNGSEALVGYLSEASEAIMAHEDQFAFAMAEWDEFREKYMEMGMPAMHHSEAYRKSERPSYRIVYIRSIKRCIED